MSAAVTTALDGYTDPLACVTTYLTKGTGTPLFRSMAPKLIQQAADDRLLSAVALQAVAELSAQGSGWGNEPSSDGAPALIETSIAMLQQSYHFACEQQQPHLALTALLTLQSLVGQSPSATTALAALQTLDLQASTRVAMTCQGADWVLQLQAPTCLLHMLEDVRALVKHQRTGLLRPLEPMTLCIAAKHDTLAALPELLEMMDLLASHWIADGSLDRVLRLPGLFPNVWAHCTYDLEAIQGGPSSESAAQDTAERKLFRHIQLSMAHALTLLGRLADAATLYTQIKEQRRAQALRDCLQEGRPYWSKGAMIGRPRGWRVQGACHIPAAAAGGLGCLLLVGGTGAQPLEMFTLDLASNGVQEKTVPPQASHWTTALMLPEFSATEFALLAGCPPEGLLTLLMSPSRGPVELWSCSKTTFSWVKVPTHGAVPDQSMLRMAQVIQVGQKAVLFAQTPMISREDQQHNVFVLDIVRREWMCLPHPYQAGNSAGPRVHKFPHISGCALTSTGSIALLRVSHHAAPRSANVGEELIPKYALDLLTPVDDGWEWRLCIPTKDGSGYTASITLASCVAVHDTLIVISGTQGMPSTAGPLGSIQLHFDVDTRLIPATLDVLDADLQWTRPQVLNSAMLGPLRDGHAVYVARSDCLWLVADSNTSTNVYCLHAVKGLRLCQPDARKKAQSLRQQAAKSQRHLLKPLRTCTWCKCLESPGFALKKCSRCKGPVYCGHQCQKLHWRAGHKADCQSEQ